VNPVKITDFRQTDLQNTTETHCAVITVLHALHTTRSSHEKPIRLSVFYWTCDLWQNERKLCQIVIPHERSIILV